MNATDGVRRLHATTSKCCSNHDLDMVMNTTAGVGGIDATMEVDVTRNHDLARVVSATKEGEGSMHPPSMMLLVL